MTADLGYAFRVLRKSPGFTAAVALSLALGIGANTAIFSLIDAVMWRMLPVKNPESLLVLMHRYGTATSGGFTYQQYRVMRQNNHDVELAAYSPLRLNVSVDGSLEPTAGGQMVSGNYFSLLGVNPAAGRAIGPDDDRVPNGHPVAMISYGYWKRRFGLSPEVIGRKISISGAPFTIIGVAPPEFFGVEVGSAPDIFVPVMMQPTVDVSEENLLENPIIYSGWLQALVRLNPGVQPQQAAAALTVLFRQELPSGPKVAATRFGEQYLVLNSASAGLTDLRRQFSQPLFILMAVVGVVLLIACANTANLLLARAASRQPEFAMRLALGAGRRRLARQLLVESVVLAALGGVLGIALARLATRLLVLFMSTGRTPIVLDLGVNLRVLAFTAAVSVATGILFGLAPAFRAARVDPAPALKNLAAFSRGGLRAGKVLAVLQVALSLVLLAGAALFVRSLQNLSGRESGRQSVLMVRVEPRGSDQRNILGTSARLDRIYQDLIARVAAIPGVRFASMAQSTPTQPNPGAAMPVISASGDRFVVPVSMLYPNYFVTAGIPMVAGREFNAGDLSDSSPAVCIVNEAFVRQIYPGENPIGKSCVTGRRPRLNDTAGVRYNPTPEAYEIVGVAKDSRYMNPTGDPRPLMYMPFSQTPTGRGQMVLYVRAAGDPNALLPRLRDEVWRVDQTLPQFTVHTLAEEMDAALIQDRLIATLSSLFGALALLLASVGLYGLLAFAVVQRTGEIGIRMALGALRGNVLWMMLREALILVLAGVLLGVPAAVAVARLASHQISGLLFGLSATDPLTIAFAAALLVAVAAVAAYLPARRASRVEPMVALRNE